MQAAYPGVAILLNGTAVLLMVNAVKDLLFGILVMLLIFGPKVVNTIIRVTHCFGTRSLFLNPAFIQRCLLL